MNTRKNRQRAIDILFKIAEDTYYSADDRIKAASTILANSYDYDDMPDAPDPEYADDEVVAEDE